MTVTVRAEAEDEDERAAEAARARLARDLALLQARFGPPQPRAPQRGQPGLPGLGRRRRAGGGRDADPG